MRIRESVGIFAAVLLIFLTLLFCSSVSAKTSAEVSLSRDFGYRIGDVVSARVKVNGIPEGYLLDAGALPQPMTKLNGDIEFAGWERDGDSLTFHFRIFRGVEKVTKIDLPFPNLVYVKGKKTITVTPPKTEVELSPLSYAGTLRFLPSVSPQLFDPWRKNGPLFWLGIAAVIGGLGLIILIGDILERRSAPRIHPYHWALKELRLLRKNPDDAWVERAFSIFHGALNRRFGKVVFAADCDELLLGEVGKELFRLSDRRLYHEEEPDLDREKLISMMEEFFTKLIWEES